jgi:hypothetical protein
LHFDVNKTGKSIDAQAFEQVVTRFDRYLQNINPQIQGGQKVFSLVVHDNSQSVALKHTKLMRQFHKIGTPYGTLDHIIETPLFVDSSLTRMVQIADLCAYALRRYLENRENDLFHRIFARADRAGPRATVVGVRHFTDHTCTCEICLGHNR